MRNAASPASSHPPVSRPSIPHDQAGPDPFVVLATDYTRAQLALLDLARELGPAIQHVPLRELDAPTYVDAQHQLAALARLMADVTAPPQSAAARPRGWSSAVAERFCTLATQLQLDALERVLLSSLLVVEGGLVLNPHLERPSASRGFAGAQTTAALDIAGLALLASRDPRAPDPNALAALRDHRPLMRHGLVVAAPSVQGAWSSRRVSLAEELVDWLLLGATPSGVPGLRLIQGAAGELTSRTNPEDVTDAAAITAIANALSTGRIPIIPRRGAKSSATLAAAAARLGRPALELQGPLPQGALELATWHAALRWAAIENAIIVVVTAEGDDGSHLAPLLETRPAAACVAMISDHAPIWPASLDHDVIRIADASPAFGKLATPIDTATSWHRAVFDAETKQLLQDIIDACRFQHALLETWGFAATLPYGRAVTALLAGPPGTGKTMSASLIAHELGRPLFRVDLARIVSKYIGETEKQLGRVFDEAEGTGAILLFDEADALFSKRTEVKSSNDRHANLEVNFLLQRLETFTGVVILTTNHEHLIDPAFKRRLRYRIAFPSPDLNERLALWETLIPRATPLGDDVDLARLAERFPLSGGHMLNALVRAATRAMAAGTPMCHHHLEESCQIEYAASGRV